jgi:nucleoside-diphosphate-sugar epimerase
MSVLIIGVGLVGSQIARLLVEGGEHPVLMDVDPQTAALGEIVDLAKVTLTRGDVLRPLSLSQAILAHGVTRIVHTAANPMLTLGAQTDPFAAIQLNVMGTVNVLEAARVHKIRRVVVASSNVLNHYLAGGEGDDPAALLREEAYPRPTTFYATTKQTIENLGLNYARWCGVDFAAVRYGAVAGPWNGRGGGGPSNVFREAVVNALAGREALVPAGTMEWVYAKDAASGTVGALRAADLKSRIFNLTMGKLTTPEDFAASLAAAIPGARVRIETPADRNVSLQNMLRASDLRLAKASFGYVPRFDMAAAVADMVTWCRANPAAIAV